MHILVVYLHLLLLHSSRDFYLRFSCSSFLLLVFFFFFNDTATTEIYTLSLHDALPILDDFKGVNDQFGHYTGRSPDSSRRATRSEEHTSELQSRGHLVCRLLLEKKKRKTFKRHYYRSSTNAGTIASTVIHGPST